MWGAFAFVGADMHLRFSLSYTLIGLTVGAFGIGGLIYAGTVQQLVARFGQVGLARTGSVVIALAYLAIGFAPVWWIAPLARSASVSASTCCTTRCRPTPPR